MAVYKRGGVWWFSFLFAGRRIQESTKSRSRTVAREAEKARRRGLERTLAGLPEEDRSQRVSTVAAVVGVYRDNYALNHRPKSVRFSQGCLRNVEAHLGCFTIDALTVVAGPTHGWRSSCRFRGYHTQTAACNRMVGRVGRERRAAPVNLDGHVRRYFALDIAWI